MQYRGQTWIGKADRWLVVFLEVAEAPAIALSEELYRVTEVGRPRLWVLEVRREELGEPLEGNFVPVGNDCRGFGGPPRASDGDRLTARQSPLEPCFAPMLLSWPSMTSLVYPK